MRKINVRLKDEIISVRASYLRNLNLNGLKFYAHRKPGRRDDGSWGEVRASWTVTEYASGFSLVSDARSQAKAVAMARQRIEANSFEKVFSAVVIVVNEYGFANEDEDVKNMMTLDELAK